MVVVQHLNFLSAPALVVVTASQLCHTYYHAAHNTELTSLLLRYEKMTPVFTDYYSVCHDAQNINKNFIISGWSHSAGL